jgi:hypothetical protein
VADYAGEYTTRFVPEALNAVNLAISQQANDPEAAAITIASAQVWAVAAVAHAIYQLSVPLPRINENIARLAAAVEKSQRR